MYSQELVNVVLTGDENYVMPIGVAMYSIVKNLSSDKLANFFLIVSGWGDDEEKEIRKLQNCNITIIHAEQYLDYFSEANCKKFKNTYIKSLSPYYRLLIPKVLPDYVDKTFYFDADMVADSDLSAIYTNFDNNKLCAAVIELVANEHYKSVLKHLTKWIEFKKFNSDRLKYPYFNAGFFLLNVKLARKLNIFDEFLNFLKAHPNPPYADQDTLNAICGQKYSDRMVYLPLNWNVFTDMNYDINTYFGVKLFSHLQLDDAFKKPYIYHYAGPNKPWINNKVLHYWNVWQNYYNLSPFKKENIKDVQISWIYLLGIPFIKIKRSKVNRTIKTYLLGLFPIYRKYYNKLKIYLLGILLLKIKWQEKANLKIYLFGILPIIIWKKKDS